MCKINKLVSEKADAAKKRRTDAEVALLERLSGAELDLFEEFVDAWMEYEDCLKEA